MRSGATVIPGSSWDETQSILSCRDDNGRFLTWMSPFGPFGMPNDDDPIVNANVITYLGDREETRPAQHWIARLIIEDKVSGSSILYNPMDLYYNRSKFAGIRLYTDRGTLDRTLIEGRVDAVFGDALGFWKWLGSPEGAGFACAGETYRLDEGIGIAVRKKDDALRWRLNRAIRAILVDGTYEKINARYFPFSIY